MVCSLGCTVSGRVTQVNDHSWHPFSIAHLLNTNNIFISSLLILLFIYYNLVTRMNIALLFKWGCNLQNTLIIFK